MPGLLVNLEPLVTFFNIPKCKDIAKLLVTLSDQKLRRKTFDDFLTQGLPLLSETPRRKIQPFVLRRSFWDIRMEEA